MKRRLDEATFTETVNMSPQEKWDWAVWHQESSFERYGVSAAKFLKWAKPPKRTVIKHTWMMFPEDKARLQALGGKAPPRRLLRLLGRLGHSIESIARGRAPHCEYSPEFFEIYQADRVSGRTGPLKIGHSTPVGYHTALSISQHEALTEEMAVAEPRYTSPLFWKGALSLYVYLARHYGLVPDFRAEVPLSADRREDMDGFLNRVCQREVFDALANTPDAASFCAGLRKTASGIVQCGRILSLDSGRYCDRKCRELYIKRGKMGRRAFGPGAVI